MAEWLKNAVFYEIYPQSFRDSNADGIGDIPGIIEKLDYIRDLGCNAIWMNPCFQSPFNDAGYDVEDYYSVAPRYGTNEDLKRLFDEVHARSMHILLDLVPGHTSYKHPWFQASMKAERNEFTDRYVWTDGLWNIPAGMQALRGVSPRLGCAVVNFFSTQPALNYGFYRATEKWMQTPDAPGPRATLRAMEDVMRFWLSLGCDGFRVDMAASLIKNDDEQGTGILKLWHEVRAFLDQEFKDVALVSEWGEPDRALAAGFHMDFLLHFGPSHYNDLFRCDEPYFSSRGKGEISAFIRTYSGNYEKTKGRGLICIPSGNHDMDRLARRLSPEEIKLAFMFLLTMPGAPFIYYGDEIGMRHVENLTSVEGGFERTGARSPMQWNKSANAGFSSGSPEKLYIKLDDVPARPDAETQMRDPASVYAAVKRLIALRQGHKALQNEAEIRFLTDGGYPLAYLRQGGGETLLVVINPSAAPVRFECAQAKKDAETLLTMGGRVQMEDGAVRLTGGSAVVARA